MISALVEILLVDDDVGDVVLTQESLKNGKVANNVHVARDGYEALAFLRHEKGFEDAPRPDLIFLDLNMPRKDGIETLAEIKEDHSLSSIPIVILTTSDNELDVKTAYRLHANCYVTKPVNLESFNAIVQSIDEFWIGMVRLPGKPTTHSV